MAQDFPEKVQTIFNNTSIDGQQANDCSGNGTSIKPHNR